ncbi:MAG: tctC [candidate division NC10 bacterium]|nr:tctC [candidate division NC10 bacterium]
MRSRWSRGWILAVACALCVAALPAGAQEYPSKPIEVVVGAAPGGGTDMIARAVADVAPKYVGQPLVVVNKVGAAMVIAAQYVATSKPDGYTLNVAGGSETVAVPHFRSVPYDPINDFEPVIRFIIERVGFYVKADSPWKSMKDFVADAKQNPDKYSYAHAGVGGIHHATMLAVEKRAGIRLTAVPHKGGAENLAALAGGHVSMAIASPNEAYALVQSGRVRPLANASAKRAPNEPDTPTLREMGIDVYIENQKGFVFPKGTPAPIVQKLHDNLRKVFDDPQFKANAEKLNLELAYLNGEDFRKALKSMYDQIGEAVKK